MRRRDILAAVVVVSVVALVPQRPLGAAETPEDAAKTATDAWLALVDQAKYAESWDQAAKVFKGGVARDKWKEAAGAVREPLGKVVSRTLKSRRLTESLPGAPDGRYVVIEYTTEFEHKKAAVETVTPMVDPDGAWRVAGYLIR